MRKVQPENGKQFTVKVNLQHLQGGTGAQAGEAVDRISEVHRRIVDEFRGEAWFIGMRVSLKMTIECPEHVAETIRGWETVASVTAN